MKIVIRAGGVGSRLWPVSREKEPKQFHALTGDQTMLQEAIDRIREVAEPDDIYISTHTNTEDLVRQRHNDIPAENIIVEPERKDTAAAIGLESVIIAKKDPEAIVASLGSDHSVRRVKEFQRMLWLAEEFVRKYPEYIIPIGIRATRPDTGYGYIEYGEVIDTLEGKNLWHVDRFTEKPSEQEAKKFLEAANFLWNANMFVWRVDTILNLYKELMPDMYEQLMVIQDAIGTDKEREVIEKVYPELEKIAVDYAIIEKTDKIAAIAADIGWNDVGDWARLKDELAESEEQNVVIGPEHVSEKTSNSLIYTSDKEKLVATIAVDNLIVVDTGDVLLICDKYRSPEVKDIVNKLKERKKSDLV